MDLSDLRTFLVVAEECHFGRAAERLGISLAQVSQRIRRLEDDLNAELLARTTRTVSVTEIGQELVAEGRDLLAQIDGVAQHIRRLASGQEGVLRLGVIGSVSYTLLPRIAQIIETTMPGIKLKVQAGMFTPAQEQALLDRSIDIGLLRLPIRIPGLAYRVAASDPLVLVLAAGHPLADRPEVQVEDLREEAFITYPHASGSVVREAVLRQCERAGFVPHSLLEVSDTGTLIGLVASGLGVALVPRSAQSLRISGVKYVDLSLTENMDIALTWRQASNSLVLRRVLGVLDDAGMFIGPEKHSEVKP
ncbi:LysR family transcriptional regulator [Oleispirillum naphthae]|uniref:LysR family transcriptional regulator n=1 Tax=Oleispirillum naphthae TaxID=2838853 RepID=UPI003082613F